MDMIEDNERLLQQFFSEAASQQIDDNGFTERVMQRLSSADAERTAFDVQRVSRLWTWFCILLFVVLFIACRGWELLAVHFEVMLRTMATQSFSINLMMLFTVVFGLLFVGVGEVISSEIVRK
jgi:hypothetical protein